MVKPLDASSLSPVDSAKLIRDLSARIEQLESENGALRIRKDLLTEGPDDFRTIVSSEPGDVKLVDPSTDELERSGRNALRAERLASLDTLAVGLAHELNNPLGTILLGAETALESVDDPAAVSALRGICDDVRLCGRIVSSVLQFGLDEPSAKWPMCRNSTARKARDHTRSTANQGEVRVEMELEDRLSSINGNETELERVLINLIENAVLASSPGGIVTVRTRNEGERVCCEIEDHGSGMTPLQKDRAFDPFFTTRIESGGTGLGLSVAHGIVRGHDGTIVIKSAPSMGTTVMLAFSAGSP